MALTKVTGQVINTSTDVTVGVLTVTNTLAVGGTVSIGGTLTYEDVTNIDSVGLVTARNGIVVGSGITLSKDGDGFFTGVTTATTFVGALTGNVTGTASGNAVLTGSTNNTLVTVTGSNVISGESLLTYSPNGTLDIKGTGEGGPQVFRDGGNGPDMTLHGSRGTIASPTASAGTDLVGNINFAGYDGSAYHRRASINAIIDGTVVDGTNDVPLALILKTGTTTAPSERLRITSGGNVMIGDGTDTAYAPLHVYSENNRGLNAIFGKGFVDSANYHYDDANIQVNGRDVDGNDTGAGIEFNARDTGNSNWLHSAITQDRSGNLNFLVGGSGTTAGQQKLRLTQGGVIELDRGSATEQAIDIKTTATSGATRAIRFIEGGTHKADVTYSHDNDRIELVGTTGQGAAIYTGGNLSQLIDSNGYRMLPRNVIFHAYGGQNIVAINTDIIFGTERFDIGGGYDHSNGVFTAPVGGYYHFYAQVYRRDTYSDCHWGFQLDTGGGYSQVSESRMQNNYGGDSGRGYSTLQCSLYWYMGVGHKMKCRVGNVGEVHCNPTLSYYCGNLVG